MVLCGCQTAASITELDRASSAKPSVANAGSPNPAYLIYNNWPNGYYEIEKCSDTC